MSNEQIQLIHTMTEQDHKRDLTDPAFGVCSGTFCEEIKGLSSPVLFVALFSVRNLTEVYDGNITTSPLCTYWSPNKRLFMLTQEFATSISTLN